MRQSPERAAVAAANLCMAGMYCMKDLLDLVLRESAEELLLHTNQPPVMVTQGRPRKIDVPVVTTDNVVELFQSIATEEQGKELRKCGSIRFIYLFQNSTRFAVTAMMQRETVEMSLRRLDR